MEKSNYSMMNNLKADLRNIGLEPQLLPMVDHIASQRINMCTTGLTQAMVPDGREMPCVASGMEREYMKYTFNATRFEQNSIVLACIPMYRNINGINYCPKYVLVYYGEDDGQVHSMWIQKYTQGTNGFGYDLNINKNYLVPNMFIPKGTCISHANTVDGSKYCLGSNLNICYGTFKEVVEDAFAISETAAKKLTTTGYTTIIVPVGKNMIPLNIYGDINNYKFLPELGEKVREDGIICAFRYVDDMSFIADMTNSSLMVPQHGHDNIYYAQNPGSVLVDIRVDKNPNRKIKTPEYIFQQTQKYEDEMFAFMHRIIKVYEEECVEKARTASKEFTVLVKNAAEYLHTKPRMKVFGRIRKSVPKLSRKSELINFMEITMTFRYKIPVSLASKITGRSGDKGVVSAINCV